VELDESSHSVPHWRCEMMTHTVQSKWRPSTRLGWWAVWLMAAFVAMFLVNSFVFMPTSSGASARAGCGSERSLQGDPG
jgi:hypothetical protein